MTRMHAAKIDNSERLVKVLNFLRQGPATTFEIVISCSVCAVNSIISELRANGYSITCSAVKGERGVYLYTLEA